MSHPREETQITSVGKFKFSVLPGGDVLRRNRCVTVKNLPLLCNVRTFVSPLQFGKEKKTKGMRKRKLVGQWK